jgi:hypothetical protein
MTDKKLVYIASPYAGDVEKNTAFAAQACRFCIARGHVPIAPHLLYTRILDDSDPAQREIGLDLGRRVLSRCDELWVCGDRISSGMAAETAEAVNLGIPVKRIKATQIHKGSEMPEDMRAAVSPSGEMKPVMR